MRYFLGCDDDGHWYLVPYARLKEWDDWCEIPGEDEHSWVVPGFAKQLDGGPSGVVFENPIIDGKPVTESD